ncbi:MAG: hypothetical protein WCA35_07270 [Kovacikia sp.]
MSVYPFWCMGVNQIFSQKSEVRSQKSEVKKQPASNQQARGKGHEDQPSYFLPAMAVLNQL